MALSRRLSTTAPLSGSPAFPLQLLSYSFIVSCELAAMPQMGREQWSVSPLLKPLPAPIRVFRFPLHAPSCPVPPHVALCGLHPACLLCSAGYAQGFTPHFVPLLSSLVGPLPAFLPWIPKLYKETPLPSLLHEEQHETQRCGGGALNPRVNTSLPPSHVDLVFLI